LFLEDQPKTRERMATPRPKKDGVFRFSLFFLDRLVIHEERPVMNIPMMIMKRA